MWGASFIPGLAPFTVPAAAIMSGISAASGMNDAITKKELTLDNGLDMAGAIPITAVTNKAMKPIMKMVGKNAKYVKSAPIITKVDDKPVTIYIKKVIHHGGRNRTIMEPKTINLGKTHSSLISLAKSNKKYIPFTAFKFGM